MVNLEAAQLAENDWLQSLAHFTLQEAQPQSEIAQEDAKKWKAVRRQIAARNLLLLEELHRVLEEFDTAGIRVIVLKGAALAENIYPSLELRFFGDIDLLIRREVLPEVLKILTDLGYASEYLPLRPGGEDFQAHTAYVKHGVLPIVIEPHWALGPPYPFTDRRYVEGLWQGARKTKIAGVDTLVLGPEDFLLHLCLHLFKHRQETWLTAACDIAVLVRHYQATLDWQAFMYRVKELKTCLPVRFSLQKTFELFQPPIPAFVMQQLGEHKPGFYEKLVFVLINQQEDRNTRGAVSLELFLTVPGIARKIGYLWAMLVPSREFMANHYGISNPNLITAYYFLRLKETLWLTVKGLFKLIFKPALVR